MALVNHCAHSGTGRLCLLIKICLWSFLRHSSFFLSSSSSFAMWMSFSQLSFCLEARGESFKRSAEKFCRVEQANATRMVTRPIWTFFFPTVNSLSLNLWGNRVIRWTRECQIECFWISHFKDSLPQTIRIVGTSIYSSLKRNRIMRTGMNIFLSFI